MGMLKPINFKINGGSVVMLKGSASLGKKNVLRMMARHFIPTTGFIHYPARWRTRYMDATILFFGGDMNKLATAKQLGDVAYEKAHHGCMGTLEYNLKFGAQFKHPEPAKWDREIFDLLELLGVSSELIGTSPEEFAVGPYAKKLTLIGLHAERLSLSDRALCTVARALLSSADLLLMSNVFDVMGYQKAVHVVGILKEYTNERAMSCLKAECASTPKHLRKQKIIVFSSRLAELETEVTRVIELGDGFGDSIRSIPESEELFEAGSLQMNTKPKLPPIKKGQQQEDIQSIVI